MTKQEYIRQVVKRLRCTKLKKSEIERQLESDIDIAVGDGRQLEDVLSEMGAPEVIAKEFNDNMDEREQKSAKRSRWITVSVVVVCFLAVVLGLIYWMVPKAREIEDSKVFSEAEVRAKSEEVIRLVSEGDEETLEGMMSEEVREALRGTSIAEIKRLVSEDWGALHGIGSPYMTEIRQMGERYALVQVNASYDNVGVTFTLSFNEEMELYGLYMK